jgi:hypothetical protein
MPAMPYCVRVFCPECLGESADPSSPPCLACLCGGHIDINRNQDGSVPATHADGSPVREWLDAKLPECRFVST